MDAAVSLRTARLRSGLSLRELAERAGTSHATLSAYESGAKVPRVDTLDRIVRAAGFASDIDLAVRADGHDRRGKGDELVAVLELAAQFPARHASHLVAPVFGRVPVPAPAAA
jgi:transcriptional regulator with XRE-family HTH domain